MKTGKWFDRKFEFNLSNDQYAALCKRLEQSTMQILQIVAGASDGALVHKPDGKWSVKEHIGHLCILENLWQDRVVEIQRNNPELTPADLENKATFEAGFNQWNISVLTRKFSDERTKTLKLLRSVKEEDKTKTSIHPRLKQPMRLIDVAYFAAEHDDHHLQVIKEILDSLRKQ